MYRMVMTLPVSVVIPARNEEEYISAALASVGAQTYPLDRIECVVVDNGSTDRTSEVARAFALEHPELRLSVAHEPEPSIGRAKNCGAQLAAGQILVFLDADSRMEPSLIADVVAHYDAGSPAGSIRIVADSADPLERGFFALTEIGKVFFGIRAQMMYCERAFFLNLGGFRPDLRHAEDLEFLRRARKDVRRSDRGTICHIRGSAIATSPRRLQGGRFRRNLIVTFIRWLLASMRIGRKWEY